MPSLKFFLCFFLFIFFSSSKSKPQNSKNLERILKRKLSLRTSSYEPTKWTYDCECKLQNNFKKCVEWSCDQKDVTGVSCFPPGAKVQLSHNLTEEIENLQQGDKIITFNSDGKLIDDEVIGFLHFDAERITSYLEIETDSNEEKLLISNNHLIFEKKTGSMLAKKLNLNDTLLQFGNDGIPIDKKIIGVKKVVIKGAYAPLTRSGTLLVNGKLVSCYANYQNHSLAHKAFGALRLFYDGLPKNMKYLVDSKIDKINWYAKGLMWIFRNFIDESNE
jgi:hypothetical protein